MGFAKDRMIEQMQEEREDLTNALDDIESYGESFRCPNEGCDSDICSKECFARNCFDWCLYHNHPSVEEKHGTRSVKTTIITRDAEGQKVTKEEVEERQICGHQDATNSPGDCSIVRSPFLDHHELWEFENERRMQDMMARESP